MPRVEYLIQLPALYGNPITEAVRRFAEKMGLEAELWRHELPLWSVSSVDKEKGIVRRVQIGAYRLDDSEEVRAIPAVFKLHKGQELAAFEEIDPTYIRRAPIQQIANNPKEVSALLEQAWADALRMPPPDASPNQRARTVSIPISPRYKW